MVIMNDSECQVLLYYVIYYESSKKRHAANREGSFTLVNCQWATLIKQVGHSPVAFHIPKHMYILYSEKDND